MESHRGRSRADILRTMQSPQSANWLTIADLDTITPEQRAAFDTVRALTPARVIAVGVLGTLRKPLRQSYLFDAIVTRTSPISAEGYGTPSAPAGDDARAGAHGPILVAEDNAQLQRLLKLQFDTLGVPVTFVSDGRQAVEAVRDGTYAMVFMDCQMPVMDGLEAARAIRAAEAGSNRHIPIAAMTANAFAEDRAASFAAGMDDQLAKPVKLETLRTVIERWGRTTA
jgi:two-component system sensor histidine kinase/response regulator